MVAALLAGLVLGLSAGLAPGPLLAFVLAQTLRYGTREGLLAALAPLISDFPIVLACWLVVRELKSFDVAAGLIALLGAVYLLYLALEMLKADPAGIQVNGRQPRSLLRGSFINFLNPHPYLFWISVGVPLLMRFGNDGVPSAAGFLFSFYALLVGSKLCLAWIVGRSRGFLKSGALRYTLRGLGISLIVLSLLLVRESYRLLQA